MGFEFTLTGVNKMLRLNEFGVTNSLSRKEGVGSALESRKSENDRGSNTGNSHCQRIQMSSLDIISRL